MNFSFTNIASKNITLSKRIPHREMPSEVVVEVGVQDGPFLFAGFLRVVGFHTGVETDQEEIEIETEA